VADRVRLAIVGLGRMGRTHLRALLQPPPIPASGPARPEATAVVEPIAKVREELAGLGLGVHATVAELCDHGGVDAAIVATPTNLHRAVTEPLLEAGLPVLCEKPCCLDPADTRTLAVLARNRGVHLQVGYWRRFVPELVGLHDDIHAGHLGELSMITCQQWDEHPPTAAFHAANGGIAVDMGVHEFDQLRWLTGQEITRIVGMAGGTPADPDQAVLGQADPDNAELLAQLTGGIVALVSLGRRFPGGDMCRVEVIGTRSYRDHRFLWPPTSDESFLLALRAQVAAFAAVVAGGRAQGATPDDAVAALIAARRADQALSNTPVGGRLRQRTDSGQA
jgi:myo-inositol 2-dehydrogenase / D-chiro-inositol 1-dehydrogenase